MFKQALAQFWINLQALLPLRLLSMLMNRLANCQINWIKNALIKLFIYVYGIDLTEAERQNVDEYRSLADFFSRSLRPEARPIKGDLIAPVDGNLTTAGAITYSTALQAKGQSYSIDSLLGGGDAYSDPYRQGFFATFYLAPKNYHRVHMPCAARLVRTVFIPGRLFAVNEITAENMPQLFTRNERLVCHFESAQGPFALVMIGAMFVGSIQTIWRQSPYQSKTRLIEDFEEGRTFSCGEELGFFNFGSTVVLCFNSNFNLSQWNQNLTEVQWGQSLLSASESTPKDATHSSDSDEIL